MNHQSNVGRLSDTSIHGWYRMVYAFSDQIIYDLAEEWDISDSDLILDPFVGTGTTVVAAKTMGIDAIGADTSPIAVLASRAKTTWDVDVNEFTTQTAKLIKNIKPIFNKIENEQNTTFYSNSESNDQEVDLAQYNLEKPKKTPKDWLSEKPRQKMLVLRHHVDAMSESSAVAGDVIDLIRLAMCAILPENVANVGFGPEAYKKSFKKNVPVLHHFKNKIDTFTEDLNTVQRRIESGDLNPGATEIVDADARVIGDPLLNDSDLLATHNSVDYVITSPPYPAEHDYTRNQRLELVWLGQLEDNSDLQAIKKRNIRSNTKNIYVDDDDGATLNIRDNDRIDNIVTKMEHIIKQEEIEHGFGQYYPRVVEEYFAGMQRHLQQVFDIMAPGGKAGYVVADSGSYWQVDIPTGTILGELAEKRIGFNKISIKHWRDLRATTGKKDSQNEEILILEKPRNNV